ncbi:MAG: S8 family serine peptidase [Candidatus Caenarcaniphilales bacterium]|nr:S8 family serine peptidase [Candidatus Caenarcaniphilales bacterium]
MLNPLNSHTGGININNLWREYRGEGVKIAVADSGVQHTHPELRRVYDQSLDHNLISNKADALPDLKIPENNHGTGVASLISAARDGKGITGVAYEATLTGYLLFQEEDLILPPERFDDLILNHIIPDKIDIVNNSWGYNSIFGEVYDNNRNLLDVLNPEENRAALEEAVREGREGLGTLFVVAVGNNAGGFYVGPNDGNQDIITNSRFTINVGATGQGGSITSFSTPSANNLISAPGSNVLRADYAGKAGEADGNFVLGSGTSFSAAFVSGVIALMLEANENLGYRDVMKILAYSAKLVFMEMPTWEVNGADDWNGGGHFVSEQYGYGLLDAHAAVRLAETWEDSIPGTLNSLISKTFQSTVTNATLSDTSGTVASSIMVMPVDSLSLEHVEVTLDLYHTFAGDLDIKLISPEGTESILSRVNYSGEADWDEGWILTSAHYFGEDGVGEWQLMIEDQVANDDGIFRGWNLTLYGSESTDDDIYIYTNSYRGFLGRAFSSRRLIFDNGGEDTINSSAVSGKQRIDLNPGAKSSLARNEFIISSESIIENLFTGDGSDVLIGNDADNELYGGRGRDRLFGNKGNDVLYGEAGSDRLSGGDGNDIFVIDLGRGVDRVLDFHQGFDHIDLSDWGVESYDLLTFDDLRNGIAISFEGERVLVLGVDLILESDFILIDT